MTRHGEMEDADLDRAAELAVQGATKNSGQRCTAVKRILVVEKVADEFSALVLAKAKKLKCGNPADPEIDVGLPHFTSSLSPAPER